jgi:hypothetical protein
VADTHPHPNAHTPDDPDYIRRALSTVHPTGPVSLRARTQLGNNRRTAFVTLPADVYDNVVAAAAGTLVPDRTRGLFERRWSCGVSRSGFSLGNDCSAEEPHDTDWHCGYFWKAPLLTEAEARELGIAPSKETPA